MNVKSFAFNPFMTNCYVCHNAGEAVLIDPSSSTASEHQQVVDFIEKSGLTVRHLLLTHAHIDHIFGCSFFEDTYGQTFQMHEAAVPFIERAEDQATAFGVQVDQPSVPDQFLSEADTIAFGGVTLQILHTPGHSPDSLCFVHEDSQQAVTGDVLFQGSIGRTQGLPQTSYPQLMQSIIQKVVPLGDDVTIYPGHGPKTTIGRERRTNPFLQDELAG